MQKPHWLDNIWPWLKRNKDLWLRVLLCWGIGMVFVYFDETQQYDLRLQMRGVQAHAKDVVLVYVDEEEWGRWHGQNNNLLRSLKEFAVINDGFFWNPNTWRSLLGKILNQGPKAVGVTFFFGPGLQRPEREAGSPLFDPRVIWGALLDNEERPVQPVISTSYGSNVALMDLREDEDSITRRFSIPLTSTPHMGLRLAESESGTSFEDLAEFIGQTRIVNFRGPKNNFSSVSFLDVINNRIPKNFFRNKIVLIGSHADSHLFQTPLGSMTRAEILANIVDNMIFQRWITRLPKVWVAFYLLVIVVVAALAMSSYPQAVAFLILCWMSLGAIALSLWVFDSFYFWIPVLSPLILLSVTYIVFLGFQLALKENQTWRLQQEAHLLSELDQLKNNFVSLISHDLKTPIAKIQAICDRVLATQPPDTLREDILNVRKENTELHRYIQTILQISRLESRQMQVRRDPTDINELVDKVLRQVNLLAKDKKQNLETKLEPMFTIEVDSVLIQEVILNLVENAIKYAPEGAQIVVTTQEVDDKVIFSVQDNGPGISPDEQVRVFEKFYRGKAQSLIKGTGLGLFLVKYFVELHGGSVFIESRLGQGTRVGFKLPIAPEEEARS